MRIHLIRHGQTNWNAIRRVQGQSESVLTALGHQQATALGNELIKLNIGDIYCSSSVRTRETAAALFAGVNKDIQYMDSLREIHLGPWEGRLYEEIEAESPQDYHHFWNEPHLFSVTGAESFYQLQSRALQAITEICARSLSDDVAIVSHGALIKAVLCHYQDKDLSCLWEPPQMHNCAHSILVLDRNARGHITQIAGISMSEK